MSSEEILRECDEYLTRLRLSIDVRVQKMRDIEADISNENLWQLIGNSLEAFSLLDVSHRLAKLYYIHYLLIFRAL